MKNILKHITTAVLVLVGLTATAQVADMVIIENETINTSSDPALLNVQAGQSITIKPTTWIQPGTVFSATISADAYISVNLNSNENYVFTRAFQAPITETQLNDPTKGIRSNSDVIESITYFDGLGRPKQQVGIKASPNKKDIVTHITYDDYGRQDKQYLPFERETDTNHPIGSYTTVSINTDINSYYKTKYPDDFADIAATHQDFNAYSESIFEPSPLNRVLEQGAPGKDWKANDTNTDHTIKFDWGTNAIDEVIYFKVEFPLVNGSPDTEAPTLVKDEFYSPNQLYVTIIKDENWKPTDGNNHTTKEYKDKLGRVILKRAYNSSSPSAGGSPEGDGGQHDTYYVYDDFGNLTYVIPPKVTLSATDGVSPEELNELCYQYKYDTRNRLIEKKIPGKGDANTFESIVYNKLDQPILTQDPNQKAKNDWLFTKYDAFGRVAYTGKITITNKTRTQIQDEVNDFAGDLWVNRGDAVLIGGTTMYYNNGGYPGVQNAEVLTINYYDDYEFLGTNTIPQLANPGTVYSKQVSDQTKSLATGSKVKVLGTSYWINTVSYYDKKARPIYVATQNEYLNTTDVVETKLDFVGKVEETKTTHIKDNNAAIVTIDTFIYDHLSRLLDQKQTINDQAEEQIVSNAYDELGQLESKETGGGLQTVDYTYNVRGWLTNINNDIKDDNDLFNFRIKYNDIVDVTKKLYNGNISETSWSTASDNTTNNPISTMYTYSYDALNRITSAIDNTGNYNLTSIGYDKNGNILNLQRQGNMNSGATSFGLMDDLGYQYDNESNKLNTVTDASTSTEGFKDGTNTDDDYEYDANGNLTTDRNKGINQINYNHLNLPTDIRIGGSGTIDYVYSAIGEKLSKASAFSDTAIPSVTEYAGNYIYKGSLIQPQKLQFFNHPEGYVEPKDENDLSQGFDYVYQYKDHLRNIRLSYSDKDGDGKVDRLGKVGKAITDADGDGDYHNEILEEKNYYPFGMAINYGANHPNSLVTGRPHNYGYLGHEEQNELGLEWLDFSARNYDPTIGRFMNIDRFASSLPDYTPYNYSYNNPVLFSDPSGLFPENHTSTVVNDKGVIIDHKDDGDTNVYLNSRSGQIVGEEEKDKEYKVGDQLYVVDNIVDTFFELVLETNKVEDEFSKLINDSKRVSDQLAKIIQLINAGIKLSNEEVEYLHSLLAEKDKVSSASIVLEHKRRKLKQLFEAYQNEFPWDEAALNGANSAVNVLVNLIKLGDLWKTVEKPIGTGETLKSSTNSSLKEFLGLRPADVRRTHQKLPYPLNYHDN